jgi:hypothetical protein
MTNQLENLYFKIALETARTEFEASRVNAPVPDKLSENCLSITRVKAIARTNANVDETRHLAECPHCAKLVRTFQIPASPSPAAVRVFDALKRYANFSETLAQQWFDVAKENARILSCGTEQWAFHDEESNPPQLFQVDDLSIGIELRQEIGKLVVEVRTSNVKFTGKIFTIILIGGTGEEAQVVVRLDHCKGAICYGSAVADGLASDVVDKLGPIIVPIVTQIDEPSVASN